MSRDKPYCISVETDAAIALTQRINDAMFAGQLRERLGQLRTTLAEIEGEEDRLSVRRHNVEADIRRIEARIGRRAEDGK